MKKILQKTATFAAPLDTTTPPKTEGDVDQTNGIINCRSAEFLVVEIEVRGSAGNTAVDVRPYSWAGDHWARRGGDDDVMVLEAAFNAIAANRRLSFRLDVRDTEAIAFGVDAISGTDPVVVISAESAGKGF